MALPTAEDPILTTVKALVSVPEDYDVFDFALATHINSVFLKLNQLGVGPEDVFVLTTEADKWTDFIGDLDISPMSLMTYVGLEVRLLFDPPTTPVLMTSLNESIKQAEWRLNIAHDKSEPAVT